MAAPRRRFAFAALVAVLFATPRPRAAEVEPDEATRKAAVDLFEQGVTKMDAGRCEHAPVGDPALCAEARELFLRSWEANPAGLGPLRNLAFVEEALGRLASAARHFRELARRAPLDARPARRLWADFARKELEQLEPRVPHLVLKLGAVAPSRTVATLDGAPLARAAWEAVIDVDPGEHAVHFEGPDLVAFDARVTLAEAESKTLVVSLLPRAAPRAQEPAPQHSEALVIAKPPPVVDRPPVSTRTYALATAGVGAAVVVVGLGYGVAAWAKRSDACGSAHYCEPAGYARASSWARAADVVTGVGAVVLASGIAWWLLAKPPVVATPRAAVVAPYASADGAGLLLVGRF